jgi:hypothetical protein
MTRALSLCVTFVVVVLGGATAIAKPQIAVLGVEVLDKAGNPTPQDTQVAQDLTKHLRSRAMTSGPYALDPGGEKELNDEKLLRSCDNELAPCMALIGKDLAADFLMYGHIEKQNNAYQVTMVLFDVAHKKSEQHFIGQIPISESTGPQLVGWARKIYGSLTGQNDSCTIVVKSNVDAGTILVNGTPKGSITNGVGQVTEPEGRYKIAVEANKDFHRWEKSDVTCTAGQTTNLPVELEKIEVGPPTTVDTGSGSNHEIEGTVSQSTGHGHLQKRIGQIATIAGVAAGGIALGSWVYTYEHYIVPQHDNVNGLNSDQCGMAADQPGTALHNACNAFTRTKIEGGLTIGFGLVGLVGAILWVTANDDTETKPATALGHRKRHEFAVVPIVGPTAGGATFSMTW